MAQVAWLNKMSCEMISRVASTYVSIKVAISPGNSKKQNTKNVLSTVAMKVELTRK
jgi:hypothetical protein